MRAATEVIVPSYANDNSPPKESAAKAGIPSQSRHRSSRPLARPDAVGSLPAARTSQHRTGYRTWSSGPPFVCWAASATLSSVATERAALLMPLLVTHHLPARLHSQMICRRIYVGRGSQPFPIDRIEARQI